MSENVVKVISRNIYSFSVDLSCKMNIKFFFMTKLIKYMAIENLLKSVKSIKYHNKINQNTYRLKTYKIFLSLLTLSKNYLIYHVCLK